jgi:hypothetical protein
MNVPKAPAMRRKAAKAAKGTSGRSRARNTARAAAAGVARAGKGGAGAKPSATQPAKRAAPPRPGAADYMSAGLRLGIAYAQKLLKDVPGNLFAHMPHPMMNHPAFCIGHLSLYGNRVLDLIGRPELVVERPAFMELFKYGTPCVEQDGRYPPKDEIIEHYLERYTTVLDVLPATSDAIFACDAAEEVRSRFPTVGAQVNFLVNNHHMTHLGQVSAWRRAVGLPPVM